MPCSSPGAHNDRITPLQPCYGRARTTESMPRHRVTRGLAALGCAVAIAACGGSASDSTVTGSTASPSTTAAFVQVLGVHACRRSPELPRSDRRGRHPDLIELGDQRRFAGVQGGAVEMQTSPSGRRAADGAAVRASEARGAQDLAVHAPPWDLGLSRPDDEDALQPGGLQRGAKSRRRGTRGAEHDSTSQSPAYQQAAAACGFH